MDDFDPYYLWLQIPPDDRPPSLYRLLGLVDFESDPEVIDNAAEQRLIHLRSRQQGPRARVAQELMNEVARARRTLLESDSKAEYDLRLTAEKNRRIAQGRNQIEVPSPPSSPPSHVVSSNPTPEPTEFVSTRATAKRLAYAKGRKRSGLFFGLMLLLLLLVGGGLVAWILWKGIL